MPHITGSSVLGLEIEANQWQQDRLNRLRADPGENARRAEYFGERTIEKRFSLDNAQSFEPNPTQIGLDAPTRTPVRPSLLLSHPASSMVLLAPESSPPDSFEWNTLSLSISYAQTPLPWKGKQKEDRGRGLTDSITNVCDKPAVVTTVASYGTRNILFKIMIRNAAPGSRAIPTLMDHLERIGTLDPGSDVRCPFSSVSLDPPVLFLPGHAIRVPASDDFILAAPIGWEVPLSESSASPLQKESDSPLVNLLVESGDDIHYRGVCALKILLNAQKYILDESILQGVKSSSSSQKLQGQAQERVIVQFYGLQFSRILIPREVLVPSHHDSPTVLLAHSQAMRFVTYNLRYDSRPDTISVAQSLTHLPDPLDSPRYLAKAGEQPWSTRRLRVAEHLLGEGIVLAGFQEALVRQVRDLHELLGEADWDWVGVGRDDGREAGEYSAVFYKKSELEYLGHDSFWTSLTPFTPSRYPGAGSIRVCTVLQLRRRHGGQKFTVLNTHMDERSEEQRRLAASMILARARFEAHTSGFPVIVMGDFNRFASPGALYLRRLTFCRSPPTGSDSGAYEISTGMRLPVDVPTDFAERYSVPDDAAPFVLRDLRGCTPRRHVSANHATFTGFSAPNDARAWSRIDFIFGGSNGGWESVRYKVDSALTDDGVLASDHRPVFADLVL
ncbi:unnamed protein product [Mycena citricolor]|uniref:Endonuclease/exonuclease/phosphatase domain-containing protein n=1 Tax=Mycena citricolor TaxID=2018698 RepID=A0AAD2HHM4_9AGAR|nr:unnamed protein product [Mycena citricolor]